ncbi:MAG: hypothetical protein MN733_20825 [Nitrososphaera sp.]|nr:hypothetical protein [Nitrososphaera sp.]
MRNRKKAIKRMPSIFSNKRMNSLPYCAWAVKKPDNKPGKVVVYDRVAIELYEQQSGR